MNLLPSPKDRIAPMRYIAWAPALLLSQHLAVALAYAAAGRTIAPDVGFWLLPLRRLALLPELTSVEAAMGFVFNIVATWALAVLTFRRAAWSGRGYSLAIFSIVPALQIVAIMFLAIMPPRELRAERGPEDGVILAHMVQGVLSGVAIIVFAVLVSAVVFGAYGWGLFVMTPFLVGLTTAYIANRRVMLPGGETMVIVLGAAGLGALMLVMTALEGMICILLAAPLAAIAALAGAALGRVLADVGHQRGKPLMSIALLPAMFALEGAMPPAVPMGARQQIDIDAPPSVVWAALISGERIAASPGLVGLAGLAYPVRGRLLGTGIGAVRLGDFSTGTAVERVPNGCPDPGSASSR